MQQKQQTGNLTDILSVVTGKKEFLWSFDLSNRSLMVIAIAAIVVGAILRILSKKIK